MCMYTQIYSHQIYVCNHQYIYVYKYICLSYKYSNICIHIYVNTYSLSIISSLLSLLYHRQVDVRIPNFCTSNNLKNNSTFSGHNMTVPVSRDLGTGVDRIKDEESSAFISRSNNNNNDTITDDNNLIPKKDLISNLSSLSLCSLTTSPSKRARVSAHATSVRERHMMMMTMMLLMMMVVMMMMMMMSYNKYTIIDITSPSKRARVSAHATSVRA
jgi:hypothetical protein